MDRPVTKDDDKKEKVDNARVVGKDLNIKNIFKR